MYSISQRPLTRFVSIYSVINWSSKATDFAHYRVDAKSSGEASHIHRKMAERDWNCRFLRRRRRLFESR